MDYKTFKFWDVVRELGWKEACEKGSRYPYTHTNNAFEKMVGKDLRLSGDIAHTAKCYRAVLADKVREYSLEKYGDRYAFPKVSDDTFWDLTAHVVGCGKEDYEKVLANPELIEDYLGTYKENFEYTFNR